MHTSVVAMFQIQAHVSPSLRDKNLLHLIILLQRHIDLKAKTSSSKSEAQAPGRLIASRYSCQVPRVRSLVGIRPSQFPWDRGKRASLCQAIFRNLRLPTRIPSARRP